MSQQEINRKEADIRDDPKLLLPPGVTEPLYQCATAVVVDKGRCRGQAISVRAIQKRLEHYARQAGLKVSCHQLRHTMASHPLLNADAPLVKASRRFG